MNRRGAVLIITYMVVAVMSVMGVAFVSRTVSENNIARRQVDFSNAFWLAEAGISRALNELRSDFSVSGDDLWSGSLSQGDYSVDVEIVGQMRKVNAHGFVPDIGSARVERIIEAMITGGVPNNFYDYAIYSAGDVDFNGNSYTINGNVLYADDFDIEHPENINGTVTDDILASPLARFDFEELYAMSSAQGNVYDEARLKDVQKGEDSFPSSFWNSEPTEPTDPTTGTPNVVYVETDLQLNGNIGTIGGFFVVVGDVITNPEDTEDLTINGNGQIEGVVYTRGQFRINGGGGNLNINGGVWAGEEARLNGNAHVAYNHDYMSAIEALDINVEIQIVWWRDTQNPFKVAP